MVACCLSTHIPAMSNLLKKRKYLFRLQLPLSPDVPPAVIMKRLSDCPRQGWYTFKHLVTNGLKRQEMWVYCLWSWYIQHVQGINLFSSAITVMTNKVLNDKQFDLSTWTSSHILISSQVWSESGNNSQLELSLFYQKIPQCCCIVVNSFGNNK